MNKLVAIVAYAPKGEVRSIGLKVSARARTIGNTREGKGLEL